MKIGFIGLGKMGSGIASNLLRAGHTLTVYNRSREKAKPLADDGAAVADTPAAAARNADAVFSMLSDDTAVSGVVFGEQGLASTLPKTSPHISCSTISVAFARKLADEHRKLGQTLLGSPVFGRPEAAAGKKLVVAVAGDDQLLEKFMPLFDAIGRKTFIVGSEPWQANAVKLCGNFMIASMLETFGEAFAALRKAGINHHQFLDVINELFGSPIYKNYGTTVANEQFEPAGFELKLGLKDVRQVVDFAQEQQAPMPIASLLRDHLLSAMANGQESLDWSSITQVSARAAGLH